MEFHGKRAKVVRNCRVAGHLAHLRDDLFTPLLISCAEGCGKLVILPSTMGLLSDFCARHTCASYALNLNHKYVRTPSISIKQSGGEGGGGSGMPRSLLRRECKLTLRLLVVCR